MIRDDGPVPLLIRRAEIPDLGLADLRIRDGEIRALSGQPLEREGSERVIDAGGNRLIPGLHDHHAHLFATAAARESLPCGPPEVNDEAQLSRAIRERAAEGDNWIRGVGFHESVCPALDRYWLDSVCPDRPLRIQHRSGMMWVYNTAALEALRLGPGEHWPDAAERDRQGKLTGRFFNLDTWLGARLARTRPSLRGLSAELAGFGVTGVTDAGARNGLADWQALDAACRSGEVRQKLLVMGTEALHGRPDAPSGCLDLGPTKIYLREADLPDYDALVRRMADSHRHSRPVAVHCVTRVEMTLALAALKEAGALPGDRIEHASIADEGILELMAELGVTAVTQPHFIAERGDQYLRDVASEDIPFLYRGAVFLERGVPLAAGSDAPYGTTDPWRAMRAAVERRTGDGEILAPRECLTPEQALALFTGDPRDPGGAGRRLVEGGTADLCLLDAPWSVVRDDLDARHVALTLCRGRVVHERA